METFLLSGNDLAHPIDDRWYDDYVPGSAGEFGTIHVTEDEIVAFARMWDPQTMHTDREAAHSGPFGGVIASGVHTMAVAMRLYVDHYVSAVASLASPGLDEVRWPRPLRPGDDVRIRIEVAEARLSRTRPDRGLVRTHVEALKQDDAVVLAFTAMNFFALRPAPTTEA